jgi:fatty acid desaturase
MTAGFYLALLYQKRSLELKDLLPLGAVYFILLQLAIVVGLAVLFSCISTPLLSAVYTFCLFVIGNFLRDVRWFGQESGSPMLRRITGLVYYLLPNFSDFNITAQVAHGESIPGYVWISNSCYALLYITVLISAAILVFEEREFR